MYSALLSAHTDSAVTTVNWACVVLSSEKTACLYYYNGALQVDGAISSAAQSTDLGTDGYSFVASGSTLEGFTGGSRTHTASFTNYLNGSTTGTPVNTEGEIDLYANAGEDIDWLVSFGSNGVPSVDTF